MDETFYTRWWFSNPPLELGEELGSLGCAELKELFRILAGREARDDDEFHYRSCPSLILRGEAQLLGLSDPRFGFRILLRERAGRMLALVNIRRVGRIFDQFTGPEALKVPIFRRLKGPLDRHKLSCIADCLIPVPARYSNRKAWSVASLPAYVTKHYGEDWAAPAVPFLRPLQFLSGGLCAQACCWMVDHYGYQTKSRHPVYALPDITVASRPQGQNRVNLAGLSTAELISYYNSREDSRLRLSIQFVDGAQVSTGIRLVTDNNYLQVRHAVEAYVRSTLPVLLLVDADRMAGRGHRKLPAMRNLYYENGLTSDGTVPRQLRIPRDKMHMVMVFGFIREGNTCIFNDPKCAPYLEADLRHLFDAACYLRPLEGDKFTFGDVLHPPSFLSVVPREVRLPLLSAYEDTELKQPVDGLFQIAMDVGWPSTDFRPEGIGGQADEAERAFLLTRIGDIQSRRHEFERMSALQLVDRLPDHLKKWSDEHWVWLELRKRGLLVWDAEASPGKWDGPDSGRSFLIEFGAVCAGDRIEWGQGNAQAEPRTYIPEIKRPTVLQESSETTIPALITSFARNALLRTGPTWCDKSVGVDLYCYQREEASELLPDCSLRKQSISRWLWRSIIQFNLRRFQNRPRLPVVRPDICICDWLAKKSGNDKYIQAATEALVKHLPKKPVACVAVSTFLPELAAHGERFRMRGVGALRFVLKLVGVLNSRYHCQIQTVELVGGSMVSNIQWEVVPSNDIEARGTTKNVFFARLDKEKARRQLYRSLQEVAADIPKNVLLALELEPGALGVIAGYGDLVALHKLLGDEACEFGDRIGFNCDIAHFTLAGITPTMLLADREGPLARITGFHLSDMGNGHFHDLVPGQAHPKAHFDDWRAVLEAAKKSPINARRSTLCISLELERSLGMSMVKDGVRTMKNFFC